MTGPRGRGLPGCMFRIVQLLIDSSGTIFSLHEININTCRAGSEK